MITFFPHKKNLIDSRNPIEKGYPSIVTPVTYFVGIKYPDIIGYTSFSDMGKFYFVGNTYVAPEFRGQGFYTKLLSARNQYLNDKPKITLVNPIDNTNIDILYAQLNKQGAEIIDNYEDVAHIMCRDTYDELSKLPIFIYR